MGCGCGDRVDVEREVEGAALVGVDRVHGHLDHLVRVRIRARVRVRVRERVSVRVKLRLRSRLRPSRSPWRCRACRVRVS